MTRHTGRFVRFIFRLSEEKLDERMKLQKSVSFFGGLQGYLSKKRDDAKSIPVSVSESGSVQFLYPN